MEQQPLKRVSWKENPDAVELGFDHYLQLVERRLRGEQVSLVQEIRHFYSQQLGIELRETQARGLMHRTGSVFIDYVRDIVGEEEEFLPNVEYWQEQGLEAFFQWRNQFQEARSAVVKEIGAEIVELLERRGSEHPGRRRQESARIIRDTALARFLKRLYEYQCQICGYTFSVPQGALYAECHHLKPLGQPHQGPDLQTNMIVLCPNHHAMMDYGSIAIDPDDLTLHSIDRDSPEIGKPLHSKHHPIDRPFLEYHFSNLFGWTAGSVISS